MKRLDENQNTQDFFGDWYDYNGYSDVGYYLGHRFVKRLHERYSLAEIANLPYAALDGAFLQLAKQA